MISENYEFIENDTPKHKDKAILIEPKTESPKIKPRKTISESPKPCKNIKDYGTIIIKEPQNIIEEEKKENTLITLFMLILLMILLTILWYLTFMQKIQKFHHKIHHNSSYSSFKQMTLNP